MRIDNKFLMVAALALAACLPAPGAEPQPARQELAGGRYRAELVRVVDGDTVRLNIELGLGISIQDARVRFVGIDAPEMKQPGGHEAKAALENFLAGKRLEFEPARNGAGRPRSDKYGRWLGTIYACESPQAIHPVADPERSRRERGPTAGRAEGQPCANASEWLLRHGHAKAAR